MNCVHGRPEGAICPHCCGNAWSNGSKTPPTDGTNSSPDRHAIIPTDADRAAAHALLKALGFACVDTACGAGPGPATWSHWRNCDDVAQALANHAASARAEEREACDARTWKKGFNAGLFSVCGREHYNLIVEELRASGADEDVIRQVRDAISRRSP